MTEIVRSWLWKTTGNQPYCYHFKLWLFIFHLFNKRSGTVRYVLSQGQLTLRFRVRVAGESDAEVQRGWISVPGRSLSSLCRQVIANIVSRGGSFKEIELSRLSSAKPAKVLLSKVWFGLSRLSWTPSPRWTGVHSRLTHSWFHWTWWNTCQLSQLSLAERS